MNKLIPVLVMLLIAVVFVSGCVTPETPPTGEPSAPAATEPAEVQDVGNGISDLDTLNQDLDISELDTLDSDLENLNW